MHETLVEEFDDVRVEGAAVDGRTRIDATDGDATLALHRPAVAPLGAEQTAARLAVDGEGIELEVALDSADLSWLRDALRFLENELEEVV